MAVNRLYPILLVMMLGSLALTSASVAQKKGETKKLPPINPTQAKLLRTFKGLDGPGFAIVSSLDAGIVAAACDRSSIQLWHRDAILGVRPGSNTANVMKGHKGTVTDLAWNGGPVLASAGADKKLVLWKIANGTLLHQIDAPFIIRALAMSNDGKLVAGAGDGNAISIWEVATGKLNKQLTGHKDWVRCLAFSPDNKQLVSGGYENEAIAWDVAGGKKIRLLPAPPKKKPKTPPDPVAITQVAVGAKGKVAALGRSNGSIDFINLANGAKTRTVTGHTSRITGLVYHPGGTLLISSSRDGSIRLHNPANGGLYKSLTGHQAWVEDVTLLARGTRLASVGADRTVRVWSLTP